MIFLFLLIALIYTPTIGWLIFGSIRLPKISPPSDKHTTKFSVIIPFRNEEKNLPELLNSLDNLLYTSTLYEVIFVNDASEDNGLELLQKYAQQCNFKLSILQNKRTSDSPKKDAIRVAIQHAANEWIITTDADCVLPKNWLGCYDRIILSEVPYMICGPVVYSSDKTLIGNYQFLDGLSLQGATMGSFGWKQPMLCNGANLAYKKSIFEAVEGFTNNDHIASGDDIFLLEKIQASYPNSVYYLNNRLAVVSTKSEANWHRVVAQRIRWASKTGKQKDHNSKMVGLVVLLGNFTLIVSLGFFALDPTQGLFLALIVGLKLGVDLTLLRVAAHLLGRPFSFIHFLMNALIYPPLVVYIALSSLVGTYEWKGRKFKK